MKIKLLLILVLSLYIGFLYCSLEITEITETYNNGATKREVFYLGNKNTETIYRKNGSIHFVKRYMGGYSKIGTWIEYNKDERAVKAGNFIVGEKEDSFLKDIKDGYYNEFFDKDKLSLTTFFFENKINGVWLEYYSNGNLKCKGIVIDGYFEELEHYNEDGVKLNVELENGNYSHTIYFNDIGKFEYYFSRKLDSESSIIESMDFGYYENGHLRSVEQKNEHTEIDLTFWDNANIKQLYNTNLKSGISNLIKFHENGRVKVSGFSRDNSNIGKIYEYFESGKIKQIVKFPNESKDPFDLEEISEYYENGNLKYKLCYVEKKVYKSFSYYAKNGELIFESSEQDDIEKLVRVWSGGATYTIEFDETKVGK